MWQHLRGIQVTSSHLMLHFYSESFSIALCGFKQVLSFNDTHKAFSMLTSAPSHNLVPAQNYLMTPRLDQTGHDRLGGISRKAESERFLLTQPCLLPSQSTATQSLLQSRSCKKFIKEHVNVQTWSHGLRLRLQSLTHLRQSRTAVHFASK